MDSIRSNFSNMINTDTSTTPPIVPTIQPRRIAPLPSTIQPWPPMVQLSPQEKYESTLFKIAKYEDITIYSHSQSDCQINYKLNVPHKFVEAKIQGYPQTSVTFPPLSSTSLPNVASRTLQVAIAAPEFNKAPAGSLAISQMPYTHNQYESIFQVPMNTSNRVAYSRPTINSRHQSNQRNDNINPQPRSFPGPISDASVPVVVFQPRELAPSQPNLGSANHTFRDHTFTEQDSMAVACLLFGLNSTVRTFNEAVKRLLQLAFVKVHPQVEKQLTDAWFAYYIQVGCNPTFENQVRALTKQTTEAEMILTFHHTFAWLGTIGILDEEPLICRPLELIDDRDYIDLT